MMRYPEYRDSGVEWMGGIPVEWEMRKVKYLFEIRKRIAGDIGYDVLSITQSGIKIKDIMSGQGQLSMDYSKYQFVYVGDFAMNHMDLLTGGVDISNWCGVTSPDYRVFALVDNNSCDRYFLYLLRVGYYRRIFFSLGHGSAQAGRWRLPQNQFNNFKLPIPPFSEQRKIASFLDRKTQQIDELIRIKERKIELLGEQRTALINQAVTKGLDPNVDMKPSGVEWIGEIPEHWKSVKLKHCIKIREGQVDPKEPEYENLTLVAPNHIEGYTGKLLYTETAWEQGAESGKYIFSEGDLLYSKIRPNLRKSCIAKERGLCSADMYPIITDPEILLPEYLLYIFLGEKFNQYAEERLMRVAMPKINRYDVMNYYISLPPLVEQKLSCAYISRQNQTFDKLISEEQRKIDLLKEYRQSLISEVVIGKIDVRSEA